MITRENVLQSGFITPENVNLVRPSDKESDLEFDAYILNKPYQSSDNIYYYHRQVDSLYSEYKNNQKLSLDFDFREKTIMAVMDAIGSPTLMQWVDVQNKNPRLSKMHGMFLEDMLNFIAGKRRSVQAESWELLIDKNNTYDKKTFEKIDVRKYFSMRPELGKIQINLSATLSSWLSQPMGFSDMIVCMGIVFGKQEGNKSVS